MDGVWTPPGPWHVGLARIRAGAGLLVISAAVQLLGMWLNWSHVTGSGNAILIGVALGAATWLFVQPLRRRAMTVAVIVTTLWNVLLALFVAAGFANQTPNVGLGIVALLIGVAGLVVLPFAEVWVTAFAGIVRFAIGMTLLVGVASTIFGGAHLQGVVGNATRGAYPIYDFRVASMLSIGVMMVVAGILCIWAGRGLALGQGRAWDHAVGGTVLLLLVAVPLCFVPVQGDLAAALTFLAAPNLVVLLVAQRRREAVP